LAARKLFLPLQQPHDLPPQLGPWHHRPEKLNWFNDNFFCLFVCLLKNGQNLSKFTLRRFFFEGSCEGAWMIWFPKNFEP
jgi:hypothetical protein